MKVSKEGVRSAAVAVQRVAVLPPHCCHFPPWSHLRQGHCNIILISNVLGLQGGLVSTAASEKILLVSRGTSATLDDKHPDTGKQARSGAAR